MYALFFFIGWGKCCFYLREEGRNGVYEGNGMDAGKGGGTGENDVHVREESQKRRGSRKKWCS
ncbi:hypothetical protein C2H98_16870 [Niallia circulans]|nr:hypothetical protein C2H98_16870 [Niallia circulans]